LDGASNFHPLQRFICGALATERSAPTLQQRVIQMVANHMREHELQLTQTLVSWQSQERAD
jgi:hypothetical protein